MIIRIRDLSQKLLRREIAVIGDENDHLTTSWDNGFQLIVRQRPNQCGMFGKYYQNYTHLDGPSQ
jgi:hypothetical protein